MEPARREQIIRAYVDAWLNRDLVLFASILDETAHVTECDGRVIFGREACRRWFESWHAAPISGRVERWDIWHIACHEPHAATMEWTFCCTCYGETTSFHGASVIEFSAGGIRAIREYRMEISAGDCRRPDSERCGPREEAGTSEPAGAV